jgi:putative FmdB family regulatory protein
MSRHEDRLAYVATRPVRVEARSEMPLYEFTCNACGERFEIISPVGERDDRAVCPRCGGRDLTAVFGSFAVGGQRGRFNPGTFERPAKGAKPVHRPGDG